MEAMKNITIKVSCDGTQLSRKVKVVNVVFNIINEKIKAATATGCYRIGIFAIDKENYESTKEWLPTIWNKVKLFTKMYYDNIEKRVVCTKKGTLANLAELTVKEKCDSISSVPSHTLLSRYHASSETTSNSIVAITSAQFEAHRYTVITIRHIFCADYKMELLAFGMYAASSNWPCIYCTQHKDKLHLLGNYI